MSSNSYRGKLLNGRCVEVTVQGQVITAVSAISPDPGLPRLLPVLVDLQHNGSLGHGYDELTDPDELHIVAENLWRHGVGRVLAATDTLPIEKLLLGVATFDRACSENADLNALYCGIFHEGIFISPEAGWRGDHRVPYILPPDWALFKKIDAASGHRIHTVNVAPEVPGMLDFIDQLVKAGKKVSLGHSNATTADIQQAVARGADRVTHFGNGCANAVPRFKNPLWEYLANPALKLGLICDGFHLPPELVQAALLAKGRNNCFAVSDASRWSSLPPGQYGRVILESDGLLHLQGETTFSGSSCQQNTCVNFLMQKLHMTLEEAWQLCSLNPARYAEIALPQLQVGDEASFVIADCTNQTLQLHATVFRGQIWEP